MAGLACACCNPAASQSQRASAPAPNADVRGGRRGAHPRRCNCAVRRQRAGRRRWGPCPRGRPCRGPRRQPLRRPRPGRRRSLRLRCPGWGREAARLQPALGAEGCGVFPPPGVAVQQIGRKQHGGACRKGKDTNKEGREMSLSNRRRKALTVGGGEQGSPGRADIPPRRPAPLTLRQLPTGNGDVTRGAAPENVGGWPQAQRLKNASLYVGQPPGVARGQAGGIADRRRHLGRRPVLSLRHASGQATVVFYVWSLRAVVAVEGRRHVRARPQTPI